MTCSKSGIIAERDEDAADRLLRRVADLLNTLAEHPEIGRSRPELGDGIRSLVATEHLGIFYSRSEAVLRLLRVLHFSRDITSEMFEDA